MQTTTLDKEYYIHIKNFNGHNSHYEIENISDLVDLCFVDVQDNYFRITSNLQDIKEIISTRNPKMKSQSFRHNWCLASIENIDFENKKDLSLFTDLNEKFMKEWRPQRPDKSMYIALSGLVLQSAYSMAAHQIKDLLNGSDFAKMSKNLAKINSQGEFLFPINDFLSKEYYDAKEIMTVHKQAISDNLQMLKRHIISGWPKIAVPQGR